MIPDTIERLPHIGVNISGLGQVNFGSTKEHLLKTWGTNTDNNGAHRLQFSQFGFFADFKKTDSTFEAVEFWNDSNNNVSQVYIYGTEVLRTEAAVINAMLQQKNQEAAQDGWFVNIDVIDSGGNPRSANAAVEQAKAEGLFEGPSKNSLSQDVERAKFFTSFGIGYRC
jgi:hypothetical protein